MSDELPMTLPGAWSTGHRTTVRWVYTAAACAAVIADWRAEEASEELELAMWLGIRATMTNTADAALDYLSDLGCATARRLLAEDMF